MSCLINSGLSKDCKYSFGGLDKIYLANRSEIDATVGDFGYEYDGTGIVTGITMVSPAVFYEYQFEKNTGSYTQEYQFSNGNKYFMQTVNFTVSGLDQARIDFMEKLGLSNVVAICLDKRGKAFVLGKQGGLEAATMTANSGAAEGDGLGITVSLSGASTEIGPEVLNSIIAGLLV